MAIARLESALVSMALEKAGMPAEVEHYERIASTNDRARAHVILGQWDRARMLCVIANYQTAGRGRRANRWLAPPGDSLLFTLVHPEEAWEKAGSLTALTAALAVAESLDNLYDMRVTLKWPNDVRIARRKIAGVLAECATGPAGTAVLLGVGVNVNQSLQDFPMELQAGATSVARECGHVVDRIELLGEIARSIRQRMDEIAAGRAMDTLSAIQSRMDHIGRMARVVLEGVPPIEGTALGVESDGGLVIRKSNGACVKCFSGSLVEL
ncbi:MAG: biotin--[acetyl-CoA-carboxylase] ligase [Candidatus Sumerlaeota bacterium]|nr:biotin--[acetyl-CoA-carboxylase] ligase [Candidatus Sumerlaeota bacterium]